MLKPSQLDRVLRHGEIRRESGPIELRQCCHTRCGQPHSAICPVHPIGRHCQNGGDVCLAGNADGVCCPEDSCDIDDGARPLPV